ncbi:unnamed protein product, partial [Meganyctiphanes norvegica]
MSFLDEGRHRLLRKGPAEDAQKEIGVVLTIRENESVKIFTGHPVFRAVHYYVVPYPCFSGACHHSACRTRISSVGPLSSNEAAGAALQLFAARARLCGEAGAKVTSDSSSSSQSVASAATTATSCANLLTEPTTTTIAQASSCTTVPQDVTMAPAPPPTPPPHPLNTPTQDTAPGNNIPVFSEEILKQTIQECRNANNYAKLRCLLWGVFSNEVALRQCFIKNPKDISSPTDLLQKCELEKSVVGCSKEELRAAEIDLDKDLDCAEVLSEIEGAAAVCQAKENKLTPQQNSGTCIKGLPHTLDINCLHKTYEALFQCPEEEFASTLMSAISRLLSDSLSIQLRVYRDTFNANPNNINIFLILLENPAINSVEYIEGVLPELCSTVSQLGVREQGVLVRHMAAWEPTRLRRLLESLHQLITIKLLTTEFTREFTINDEATITNATQVMKLLYYSSILGGKLDLPLLKDLPPEEVNMETIPLQDDPFLGITGTGKDLATRTPPVDALGSVLDIHTLDARIPVIPLSEFYDDFLSDQLEMDRDFAYYKAGSGDKFSFLHFPFVLTPATKALGLYYDNRIRMYSERRMSIYQTLMDGMPANPYLKLRVRRDHIIDDSLVELEMVALENPGDLKKQLVVEFEGEQGIDEGGVSKEFFQLIVEQIFNPDYAMFILYEETQTYWFNPSSYETDAQFTLVGIIVGLAIYNTIILDVHFPSVLYKKLCSKPGSFHDLKDWNTTLYRTLCELLEYEGSDMEDVFMQTFKVGYQDAFGASLSHELKPGGDNVFVNQSNKQFKKFVNLANINFLRNLIMEKQ